MSKWTFLAVSIVVAVMMTAAPTAMAQCATTNMSTAWSGDINVNLNHYALIWRDARNTSCASSAATKLSAKLDATTVARWDDIFMGWLLAYALASGLELGGVDYNNPTNPALLTEALDIKLRDAALAYQSTLDASCGFAGGNWHNGASKGNGCMDDYTMAVAGYGWKTAYLRLTGRDWRPSRQATIDNSKWAMTSTDTPPRTVCIRHKTRQDYVWGSPYTGYCNATFAELQSGDAVTISLNHGNQTPAYGLGLVTGIEVGFNGLDAAEAPADARYDWTTENKVVAQRLFEEGQAKTYSNGTWKSDCYNTDSQGYLVVPGNLPCGDDRGVGAIFPKPYEPKMFPILSFYYNHGLTAVSNGNYMWNTFDATMFDANDPAKFFGPARLEGYNKFANGWDWWGERGLIMGRTEYKMSIKGGSYYFQPMGGALYDTSATNSAATKFILKDPGSFSAYLYNNENVTFKHVDTGLYMVAENGGGGAVNVNRATAGPWETFRIERLGPADPVSGLIAHGDTFALKTNDGSHYISFTPNGTVTATATSVGPYETLTFTRTD
jgi:hypothetical protein